MVDVKTRTNSALSSDSVLLALIGGDDHISNFRQEEIVLFPMVIFQESNQSDFEYADNLPIGSSASVQVDIFVKTLVGAKTTWEIGSRVYDLMKADGYTCSMNGEVPDPGDGVRHRVMRFSREFFRGD